MRPTIEGPLDIEICTERCTAGPSGCTGQAEASCLYPSLMGNRALTGFAPCTFQEAQRWAPLEQSFCLYLGS